MDFWNSARRNYHRLADLSGEERLLLLRAVVLLHMVAVARRVLSFKRLQAMLTYRFRYGSPNISQTDGRLTAQRVARMVQIAAAHSVLRPTCLDRSLVLWSLLRRQGIIADIRLGVRKTEGQFEAHAWIEHHGIVLNDTGDVEAQFAAFPTAPRHTSQ